MMRWHNIVVGKETPEFKLGSRVYLYDTQDQVAKFVGWNAGYDPITDSYYVEAKNTYGTIVAYNRAAILNQAEVQSLTQHILQVAA